MRADRALVARGLAPTRSAAQRLIEAGAVRRGPGGLPVVRAAEAVTNDEPLALGADDEIRYASRGGLKLEAALARCGLDARVPAALDVGQSTGGFTDCLLRAGAQRVVGFDVGHGQLAARLRADPRVTALEGLHVRDATRERLGEACPADGFPLVVIDVSFIGLAHALGPAAALARPGASLLALVKPQFEVGPDGRDARGIVRDEAARTAAIARVREAADRSGWRVTDTFDCAVAGGDGNREAWLQAVREDLP